MITKIQYVVNDIRSMNMHGPFSEDVDACKAIDDLGLIDGEFFVTEHVTEIKEVNFKHQLSMFRHKKKPISNQITIAGEVVG